MTDGKVLKLLKEEQYKGTFYSQLIKLERIKEILTEAKKNLAEVILKPDKNDYELTIPYQKKQFEEDQERYRRFTKWFGK